MSFYCIAREDGRIPCEEQCFACFNRKSSGVWIKDPLHFPESSELGLQHR